MDINIIKEKISTLDTENKIKTIDVYNYNNGTVININYIVIRITNNKMVIYPQTNKIFFRTKLNNTEEVNIIKIMKEGLDFLDNNIDKIKAIIKEALEVK